MMLTGLLSGYYHPTRRAGHGRLFSAFNAIRLTWRALKHIG